MRMTRTQLTCLMLSLAALAASPVAAGAHVQAEPRCEQLAVPTNLDDLNQLQLCRSSSKLLLLPYLWQPIQIKITCPKRMYQVYTAPDATELQHRVKQGDDSWCSLDWKNLDAFGSKVCNLQLSPFQTTLVGVKGSRGCEVASTQQTSLLMPICGLIGLLLFYAASHLSSSFMFRMSCGTAFFTATMIAFAIVLLLRLMPHKKTMAALLATTGTTGWAAVRWVTGQWLPSWQQLLYNPYFAAYLAVSMTIGAIVTYLYDDMNNPKINTVIKAVLRCMALALVYYSTWTSWPLSATVIGLMVAGLVGPTVTRNVQETSARVQHVVNTMVTPFTNRRRRRAPLASPLVTGKQLNFPHLMAEPGEPSPLVQTPAPQATPDPDISLKLLDTSGLRGLRLRATPPAPWEVSEGRRVKTFEEQMQQSLIQQASQRRSSRLAGAAGSSGARGSQMSAPRSARPAVHYDEDEDGGEASQDTMGVSGIIRQGHILNPVTGRLIKIGGDVYNSLLLSGYEPDTSAGVMRAPEGVVPGSTGRARSGRSRVFR